METALLIDQNKKNVSKRSVMQYSHILAEDIMI